MKEVEITCDVYGAWTVSPPLYRIYIDDEMLCERAFLSMEYEFSRERLLVELEENQEHTFRFENLPNKHPHDMVAYKNLLVNGQVVRPTFTVPN